MRYHFCLKSMCFYRNLIIIVKKTGSKNAIVPYLSSATVYPGTIEGKVENGKVLPPKVSHKKKIHIFWNFATKFFWQTTNTSEIKNPAGQVHSLPITPLFDLRKLQTRPSVRYMHIVSKIFKACVCQNLSSLFCVLWS